MPGSPFDVGAQSENPIVVDQDSDYNDDDTTVLNDVDDNDSPFHLSITIDVDLTQPASSTSVDHRRLLSYTYAGLTLKQNMTVELNDGDFMKITAISKRCDTQEVFLEGHIFRRAHQLKGLLEKKKNEVVWIQNYNPNLDGDTVRQSLQRVSLLTVVRCRELVLTNRPYPFASFRDEQLHTRLTDVEVLEKCRLTCRWKSLSNQSKEGCLITLKEGETDSWYRSPPLYLKSSYRGITTEGGSCPGWLPGEKDFDKAERVRNNNLDPFQFRHPTDHLSRSGKRYTFGDGFCGAGGVSRGAKAAGLRVAWGFDFDKEAIDSYRLNFHETLGWCCPAHTFITIIPDNIKVDVLHLSFPCQPFSPAHTRPGQHDEANEASFFSLESILKRVKPRVVMVEETFGLLRTDYRMQWFRAMIQIFTKMGYSVRWKIFKLLELGLPGRRERVFVFASCPGEPLPDFPNPSHCNSLELGTKPHLSPYRTINDAISMIPSTISGHDNSIPCAEAAYDGNVPLPNAICCGTTRSSHPSSRAIHPSGKRTFTSRELACLNGFPLEHEFGRFGKTALRKQIGNAVPPIVAKVFLEQIVKCLQKTDGL